MKQNNLADFKLVEAEKPLQKSKSKKKPTKMNKSPYASIIQNSPSPKLQRSPEKKELRFSGHSS